MAICHGWADHSQEGSSGEIVLKTDEDDVLYDDYAQLVQYLLDYIYRLDYLPHEPVTLSALRFGKQCRVTLNKGEPVEYSYGTTFWDQGIRRRAGTPDLIDDTIPEAPETDPVTHVEMYAIGDYYDLPGLKLIASIKFKEAATLHWNTARFTDAAEIIMATTIEKDMGLRNVLIDTIAKHRELKKKPEFEALLQQHHDIAHAVEDRIARVTFFGDLRPGQWAFTAI